MSYAIEAVISMLSSEQGGLKSAMPNPTSSLTVVFPSEEDGSPLHFTNAMTLSDSQSVGPGDAGRRAVIEFLAADEARIYAIPGATFAIWHGRNVGSGRVLGEFISS